MSVKLNYMGGIPDFKKNGIASLDCGKDDLTIKLGFKKTKIPYGSIGGISMKTEEQISKDVTLTRLLLVGIFAFGLKKKRKEMSYGLVVEYIYGSISTSAIFTGDSVNKAYSELMKKHQKYQKSIPPVTVSEERGASPSGADELIKYKELLDTKVITQSEFDKKKKQILGA